MWAAIASTGSSRQLLKLSCNPSTPLLRFPTLQSRALFSSSATEVEEPLNHTQSEQKNNRNLSSESYQLAQKEASQHIFGHVKYVNREKRYAIIRVEESNEKVYLLFKDIDVSASAQFYTKFINPMLGHGNRVRFQIKSNEDANKETKQAYDVKFDDGRKILLLHYENALTISKMAKARLGYRCYEILSEEQDALAMSEQIQRTYEQCNETIEWAKSQLLNRNSNKIISECKAELGNDVFHILENVSRIDDIQKKVDDAFIRCERKLHELEKLGVRHEK
jgi:uncharacterized protein YlbG (UPF0298 family)